jgi:hypothetical protein
MKFYLTFGQQSPFRNGWVEVEADSYEEARKLVHNVFGAHWSFLYGEEGFNERVKAFFPSGKLGETMK